MGEERSERVAPSFGRGASRRRSKQPALHRALIVRAASRNQCAQALRLNAACHGYPARIVGAAAARGGAATGTNFRSSPEADARNKPARRHGRPSAHPTSMSRSAFVFARSVRLSRDDVARPERYHATQ
ncbi:hypothetical protein MRX96_034879 [Rhipicephalus microplus]